MNRKSRRRKYVLTAAALMAAVLLGVSGCEEEDSLVQLVNEAEEEILTPAEEQGLIDMDELTGFASVEGEGLETTTGGYDAEPQTVTTIDELRELAAGNEARVIVIEGTIACGEGGAVEVGSNKTIIGADADATLEGGFDLNGVANVIISNLTIDAGVSESRVADGIAARYSHHLWFDHLHIKNASDGLLDITLASDYATVSWCHFSYDSNAGGHRLSCLVGSGTGHDETDTGKLNVTYHHNWFGSNCDQRMPRILYGQGHVYNNYYSCRGNTYCIGVADYASVLIENNYFLNVSNPHQFMYETALPASIVATGNIYVGTDGDEDNGYGGLELGYVALFTDPPYRYTLDKTEYVPQLVQSGAGPRDLPLSDEAAQTEEASEEEDETLTVDDNPITYDAETDTYTYNGSNSDQSNASYEITNPFAGMDLEDGSSEEQGVTIAYWVNLPITVKDAAVLNFNLEDNRRINNMDEWKYNLCQAYDEEDADYSLGDSSKYVDAQGNKYKVLTDAGKYVCYNPDYPQKGCYEVDNENGVIYACPEEEDETDADNWVYLSYLGEGQYEAYHARFDEEDGENSLISEALISGSLSLYASGSVGFREDDGTGTELNIHLPGYGKIVQIQVYNQFYYWGNGSAYSLSDSDLKTPTMETRGEWHFVVAVIQNDYILYYMDGIEMTPEYLNWWGDSAYDANVAGASFNGGYGMRLHYRTDNPAEIFTTGRSILDFLSDENTTLCVGGEGCAAAALGQDDIGTPYGVQVRGITFYDTVLSAEEITADGIVSEAQPLEQE